MEVDLLALEKLLLLDTFRESGRDGALMTSDPLVDIARDNRLLVTLASARQTEGWSINAELEDEIRFQLDRAARYREIEDVLGSSQGARALKGRSIAELYPKGWIRSITDLDLEVAGTHEVIAAALVMKARGWAVTHVVCFRIDGGYRLALDLQGSAIPGRRPDWIQIQGFGSAGFRRGAMLMGEYQRLLDLSHSQRNLIEVCFSVARRRRLIARDLLDFRFLTDSVDMTDLSSLIVGLGLWPHWVRLAVETRRAWPDWVGDSVGVLGTEPTSEGTTKTTADNYHSSEGGPLSAADALTAGFPVEGGLTSMQGTSELEIHSNSAGQVFFAAPFGSGELCIRNVG